MCIRDSKEKGLADQPYYGDITLTPEGYAYGTSVLDRHDIDVYKRQLLTFPYC